jgi:hypothetical protein
MSDPIIVPVTGGADSAVKMVPLTEKMKHEIHKEICMCPRCKGTLDRDKMCTAHLFSEHFLELGMCPPLVADRLQKTVSGDHMK